MPTDLVYDRWGDNPSYIYIYGIEQTKEMHGGDIIETLRKDQSHQTKERVLCIKPYI